MNIECTYYSKNHLQIIDERRIIVSVAASGVPYT